MPAFVPSVCHSTITSGYRHYLPNTISSKDYLVSYVRCTTTHSCLIKVNPMEFILS